jgi:hypothetical protein
MGKYEVTQGEYLALMGRNPSKFTGDTNRPVEQVSWLDATNYCASSRSGSEPPDGLRPTVCIGCRRRRSGSMRPAAGPRRGSAMGMTRTIRTWPATRGMRTAAVERRIRGPAVA